LLTLVSAAAAVPVLSKFIEQYKKELRKTDTPKIKVALLDNGVLSVDVKHHNGKVIPDDRAAPQLLSSTAAESSGTVPQSDGREPSISQPVFHGAINGDNVTTAHEDLVDLTQGPNTLRPRRGQDKDGVSYRIKAGSTFVEQDGKQSPWYFPSDPHGTQMASLICAIDPRCELFVARIGDRRSGITAETVAKVSCD
jgi:hypothetical protein